MIIKRHRQFLKNYKKRILPNRLLHEKFEERLILFMKNSNNPILKDHQLLGFLKGLRAFSVAGDVRVVYRVHEGAIELYDIGSHNQVY